MVIPTCEEIAKGIHPKAVGRASKNHYITCKPTCKIDTLKSGKTPGYKSACRPEYKKDNVTVEAPNP